MKEAVIAVLDVGKTNKKLFAWDRGFHIVAEERTSLSTRPWEGLDAEDTEGLFKWLSESLASLAKRFDIKAISVTTHGATCALLDEDGKLACPVLSYASEAGSAIVNDFFLAFGDERTLHRDTSTADFGFINVAKILFYIRERLPEAWKNAASALFYPQYIGWELTGAAGRDPTYTGNHSYLWDFRAGTWSRVARGLGADRMFPKSMRLPWEPLGEVSADWRRRCGLPSGCGVTIGIHDSNASILPFFCKGYERFSLNSTGTWCVGMRPAAEPVLSEEELGTKTFYNLDAFNRPLKTSIFLGGLEYERFCALSSIKDASGKDEARRVISDGNLFVVPGIIRDASIFAFSVPAVHHAGKVMPYEKLRKDAPHPCSGFGQDYFAALNLSLALQSREMLRILGSAEGETVFIEGGFCRNRLYCEILASLCPGLKFAISDLQEATAFGAALTGWMMVDDRRLEDYAGAFELNAAPVPAGSFPGIDGYARRFENLARGR